MAAPSATSAAAHPGGEHRLARRCGRTGTSSCGRARRVGHRLRREDDQHAVGGRVRGRDLERLGVPLGRRVADDVDRVVVAPDGRQHLVVGGHRGRRAGRVSWPPPAIRASVASTPGPPALVTMVRLGPLGRGCLASTSAMSNRSEMRSTRSTPTRRKAASSTSSEPVSEPVCEAAALAACAGAAGLDDDDRLGQRDLARGRQEGARVADRLHVDEDAARCAGRRRGSR